MLYRRRFVGMMGWGDGEVGTLVLMVNGWNSDAINETGANGELESVGEGAGTFEGCIL